MFIGELREFAGSVSDFVDGIAQSHCFRAETADVGYLRDIIHLNIDMGSFFEEHAGELVCLDHAPTPYRECQIGAAWATLAHFTASCEPALVSMPTGSGKTALMMMLSFLMRAKRVIVITPSVILRGQTAKKFETLEDLKSAGAFASNGRTPKVHDHEGEITSSETWSEFLAYDVIVATPHTISPGYERIVGPKTNLFGPETVLFFDEAHHSRARTWQILIEHFASSRVVMLTATPFRNDNRRLLAKLVYHYPMKKALDSGIYAPIEYHAVEPQGVASKDKELCSKAVKVLKHQKKRHPKARLLIRAEGVSKSSELVRLYTDAGLKVAEVNYKQKFKDNIAALNDLRNEELDGIVCVDQIGEGLDVPSLKIAVLHKPRQSFPATVQFIGRICREATDEIGEPHLIACPDDVRGPLQRLYTHDNAWREFVPKLVEQIIGKSNRRSAFRGVVDADTGLDLEIEDIQPFFSTRVYRLNGLDHLDFGTPLDMRNEIVPVLFHEIPDQQMLIVVTAIEKKYSWAHDSDLATPHFDLHVFYWNDGAKLLFEFTTADKVAGSIRESLWKRNLERIDAASVVKALDKASAVEYLMFGLSNLGQGAGSIPSYKTFMGTAVEGAIRITDARSFTPGHALARYPSGETRGIGSNQARVWSIKRASLSEFKDWCDSLAAALKRRGNFGLPKVEFLPAPETLLRFKARPIAMYSRWNPQVQLSFQDDPKNRIVDQISFDELSLSDSRTIAGKMYLSNGLKIEGTRFTYSLLTPRWTFQRSDMPSLRVDDSNEIHMQAVAEYFDENPPVLLLDDGSSVVNGSRYESARVLAKLPEECLDHSRDWSKCDIHVEYEFRDPKDVTRSKIPAAGKISVQDQVEEWLKASASTGRFAVKDHAAGEIADFIEVEEQSSTIRFYHCKACTPVKQPGARLDELKALEQALRTLNHIGMNSLLIDLLDRVSGNSRPNTRMVVGEISSLKRLAHKFRANEWKFEVVLVNPGIACQKAVRVANTNTVLIACYEWLAAANARLIVVGS